MCIYIIYIGNCLLAFSLIEYSYIHIVFLYRRRIIENWVCSLYLYTCIIYFYQQAGIISIRFIRKKIDFMFVWILQSLPAQFIQAYTSTLLIGNPSALKYTDMYKLRRGFYRKMFEFFLSINYFLFSHVSKHETLLTCYIFYLSLSLVSRNKFWEIDEFWR